MAQIDTGQQDQSGPNRAHGTSAYNRKSYRAYQSSFRRSHHIPRVFAWRRLKYVASAVLSLLILSAIDEDRPYTGPPHSQPSPSKPTTHPVSVMLPLSTIPHLAFTAPLPLSGRFSSIRQVSHPPRSRPSLCQCRRTLTALISLDQQSTEHTSPQPISNFRFSRVDGLPFLHRADHLVSKRLIPTQVAETLKSWYPSYSSAAASCPRVHGDHEQFTDDMFSTLLELSRRACENPLEFSSYHERIREPFDYYKFGFDFSSILLDVTKSHFIGHENVRKAEEYARQGHNVIFISNHQSEGDPYAIDFIFEWLANCPRQFCERLIFMAGDRVRNDPVVSPFSAGRNLLTVYSKKHINDVPEEREGKLLHNRRTIAETQRMFKKGGQTVWFAPSGGRDRRQPSGKVEISDFDEGAVDMMRFTALKSGKPCHFFPMALWTYDMLPPPTSVGGAQVGEERTVKYTPMHMFVGSEIDWSLSGSEGVTGKMERRIAQRQFVQDIVTEGYKQIGGYDG